MKSNNIKILTPSLPTECEKCEKNVKTAKILCNGKNCPINTCDENKSHYHILCAKCCDHVRIKKMDNISKMQ